MIKDTSLHAINLILSIVVFTMHVVLHVEESNIMVIFLRSKHMLCLAELLLYTVAQYLKATCRLRFALADQRLFV